MLNNELFRKINNNSIRDNPTTGFVLIRTHQGGIVARNRYCDWLILDASLNCFQISLFKNNILLNYIKMKLK